MFYVVPDIRPTWRGGIIDLKMTASTLEMLRRTNAIAGELNYDLRKLLKLKKKGKLHKRAKEKRERNMVKKQ